MTTRRARPAAALAVMLLAAATACGDDAHSFVGYLQPPVAVAQITLPDLSDGGDSFALRAEPDGVLLVYFGFTNCPDYCPTTLSTVARTIDQLGDDGARVDVAMVSVDPEQDAEHLAGYVDSFVAGGHALLTDDPTQLNRAIEAFGGSYAPGLDGADPEHTTYLYGVNDAGEVVITWTAEMVAEGDLSADVGELLAGRGYEGTTEVAEE